METKLVSLTKDQRLTIAFVLLDALDDTRTKYAKETRAERGEHQLDALRALFPSTAELYIKDHNHPTTW